MSDSFHFGYELYPPDEKRSIYDARSPMAGLGSAGPEATDSFSASDGAQVPYRVWRAESPRALVLLLHGAFDYCGAFDEIGAEFAKSGITSMAIDQRGFGATYSRGTWSGENRMICDVIEAVTFLRTRCGGTLPVFLIGESMGAALAVHSAANFPQMNLAGIVLAAPGAVTGMLLHIFGALVAPLMRAFTPNSGIIAIRLRAGELNETSANRMMNDPMVLHRIRPAMLLGLFNLVRSAQDDAIQMRVPVLTMAGTKDDLIGILHIARLHKRLAGAKEWVSFEGGPHLLLHWTRRDQVLVKILSWIEAHLPQTRPDLYPVTSGTLGIGDTECMLQQQVKR